ncbi:MAG: HdeA/HdeB family chaperone [Xanthobacteraceae bacterium]
MKLRLLLTSALFLFAQMATMQAQETLDLAKITCEQFAMEKLASPSRDVVLLLTGYYNGKRNNTIIEPLTTQKNEEKVNQYCYGHRETTVHQVLEVGNVEG